MMHTAKTVFWERWYKLKKRALTPTVLNNRKIGLIKDTLTKMQRKIDDDRIQKKSKYEALLERQREP